MLPRSRCRFFLFDVFTYFNNNTYTVLSPWNVSSDYTREFEKCNKVFCSISKFVYNVWPNQLAHKSLITPIIGNLFSLTFLVLTKKINIMHTLKKVLYLPMY